jgi:hypothetical protein
LCLVQNNPTKNFKIKSLGSVDIDNLNNSNKFLPFLRIILFLSLVQNFVLKLINIIFLWIFWIPIWISKTFETCNFTWIKISARCLKLAEKLALISDSSNWNNIKNFYNQSRDYCVSIQWISIYGTATFFLKLGDFDKY